MAKSLILNGKHLVGVKCDKETFYLGDKVDTQEHNNVSIGAFEVDDDGNITIRYSTGSRSPHVFIDSITKAKGAVKFKDTTVITLEEMLAKKKAAKKPAEKPVEKIVVAKKQKTEQDREIQAIQDRILNTYPKIRITILKKRKETLQEFIYRFFNEWNHEKDTIVIDTREVQTTKSRRRSMGDVFMLCRYYYPECTLSEVFKIMYVELYKPEVKFANNYVMRSSYCGTVNRMVFYISERTYNEFTRNDEFGHTKDWYLSKIK